MSISVAIGAQDSRCRYWAKIIRAGQPLPMPGDATSAHTLSAEYVRQGEDELLPGDILIEGEEIHHRHARGWQYLITACLADGTRFGPVEPNTAHKKAIKLSGALAPEYLTGSGGIAACVRIAHALRAGISFLVK